MLGTLQWQVVVRQNKRSDGRIYSRQAIKRSGGYKSTLAFTSALDGKGGLRHVPATLPRRKRPGTDLRECGWATGQAQIGEENLASI